MSSGKGLGLAAGALLLLSGQIAGAAPAAAQENSAGTQAVQGGVDKAAYYERRTTARAGNIYGSHGVIGHTPGARRGGYYGAAVHGPRNYAHRYYRPRAFAASGYYGAAATYPRYYGRRYYAARPVVAPEYYGSTGDFSQYYARRYYSARADLAPQYYGSTGYFPQYGAQRYSPTYPVAATGAAAASYDPLSSFFGTATNWSAGCVNGRVCVGGYHYRGGVPICRNWAACNY
jgi:hypothetical protein